MKLSLVSPLLISACLMLPATAFASPITVYSNNFDGGVVNGGGATGVMSGIVTTAAVAGYSGDGFSGNLLRNMTGGPSGQSGSVTTLTLSNLPAHTSIDINFLLAVIDSWDGSVNSFPQGDFFNVRVDGVIVFRPSFVVQSGSGGYTANQINGSSQRGFGPYNDLAFNMGPEGSLNFAHTANTAVIDFFADGGGWQGDDDESWGMDNLSIDVNTTATAVPEPGTLLLLGAGLVAVVTRRRFTKRA